MKLGNLAALLTLCVSAPAVAEVVIVEVKEQRPWIAGRSFNVGEYELLSGIVRYEVDPAAPSSRDISDILLLPTNARGKVEFQGPFLLLRPVEPTRANGTTILEVPNRGLTQLQGITETDSLALTKNATRDVARSALFDRGYTFAWAGWQGDLKPDEFGLTVPSAPVSGTVRASHFVGYDGGPLDRGELQEANCAADAADGTAVLRVQQSFDDPGLVIARDQWRFARKEQDGSITADPCSFLLASSLSKPGLVSITFKGGPSKGIGLGLAAIRDFASHLKYRDRASALNVRAGDTKRVIAYGASQSARFLREYLYRGFNADVRKRRVFDGVMDTYAGAGRGSFNHRYAAPSQAGNSVGSALRAVDLYPFSNLPTPDIDGRGREGLLDRARRDQVQPRIFHVLSSSEYWARAGSLLHTATDGRRALAEAEGTRTYAFAGTPHGARRHTLFLEKAAAADLPYNDNSDLSLAMPALIVALDRWLRDQTPPPTSQYPRLGKTLVSPSALRFPKLRGVAVPTATPPVWRLDLGPAYRSQGIITEPPKIGRRYPLLVPQVDEDGNELGSWRGMALSVPLGTYTAWNHQNTGVEAFGYLSGLQGAFIPFPATAVEATRQGDPRRSVSDRYGGLTGYMRASREAAERQVSVGFLLPDEQERALVMMRLAWDRVAGLRGHWPRPQP